MPSANPANTYPYNVSVPSSVTYDQILALVPDGMIASYRYGSLAVAPSEYFYYCKCDACGKMNADDVMGIEGIPFAPLFYKGDVTKAKIQIVKKV